MYGNPIMGATPYDESAGQRHKKHQNGQNAERDAGVVPPRRGLRWTLAFAAVAVVSAVAASGRFPSAASANIFDNYLDLVVECGSRHAVLLSVLIAPWRSVAALLSGA